MVRGHNHACHRDAPRLALLTAGVWEFISSQEAVDIVAKWRDSDPQKACDALVAEAVRRWEDEEDVVDDTTCIIAFFNFKKE